MIKKDLVTILLIVISIFLFLGLTGTINSGYHFVDDHEIIKINKDFESMNFFHVVKKWLDRDFTMRFRPLYFFFRILQTKIFGTNFILWSVYNGVLASITMIAFYFSMRNYSFSIEESILFLFISFIGQQMNIWWRLGPNETIAITFLSLCFLFMSRNTVKSKPINNFLFVVFLILSSLCKESFIIIIPGVIFFKFLNENKITGSNLKYTIIKDLYLIIPLLILLVELYLIKFHIGTNKIRYAGLDSSISVLFSDFIKVVKTFLKPKLIYVAAFMVLLISYLYYKRLFSFRKLLLPIILCTLILLPNLILYSKSGMWGRYLIPSSIGVAFLVISVIKSFDDQLIWLKRLFVFLLLIAFVPIMKKEIKNAKVFAQEGRNIKILVNEIKENYSPKSIFLMVVDPVSFYEQSNSFRIYMEIEYNIPLYAHAFHGSSDKKFAERLTKGWYMYFKGRTYDDINDYVENLIFLDKSIVNDYFKSMEIKGDEYRNTLNNNSLFAFYELINKN